MKAMKAMKFFFFMPFMISMVNTSNLIQRLPVAFDADHQHHDEEQGNRP
jgi:hypothetical protein